MDKITLNKERIYKYRDSYLLGKISPIDGTIVGIGLSTQKGISSIKIHGCDTAFYKEIDINKIKIKSDKKITLYKLNGKYYAMFHHIHISETIIISLSTLSKAPSSIANDIICNNNGKPIKEIIICLNQK